MQGYQITVSSNKSNHQTNHFVLTEVGSWILTSLLLKCSGQCRLCRGRGQAWRAGEGLKKAVEDSSKTSSDH